MKSNKGRIHVVAIPYPAQGHINPMLQLCSQLVPRGFCFTFVNTEHTHERMLKQINENQHHLQHIQMVCIKGGHPPELHGFKATRVESYQASQLLQPPFENLLSSLMKNDTKDKSPTSSTVKDMDVVNPSFILSDVLLGWANASATTFGLPWIAFWPASATSFSSLLYMSNLAETNLKIDIKKDGVLSNIPGVPPTHVNLLPKIWDDDGGFKSLVPQIVTHAVRMVYRATYLIINTFTDLEGSTIEALSSRVPTIDVGPLVPYKFISTNKGLEMVNHNVQVREEEEEEIMKDIKIRRMSLFKEDASCLKWLEKQKQGTVLFISFGSISVRKEEQMLELARALMVLGCKFLWVRRPNLKGEAFNSTSCGNIDNVHEIEEEISMILANMEAKGQGMSTPWAPQLEVLAHPAVMGFLTHCGWNSIMEGVSMGVPLLCWADTGERLSNQRFAVDFWGCGVDVDVKRRTWDNMQDFDKQGVFLSSEELQSMIKGFKDHYSIATRAKELKLAAATAFHNASLRLNKLGEALASLVDHNT